MELQPFLKLQSLVVLGGKWLPFSQAGGILMFAKEPCWWHINGFLNDMTRKWLPQTKCFILFLARAFVPITDDHIWSFNSQPLILWSMAAKSSDLSDKTSEANLQVDGQVGKASPKEQQTGRRWKKRTVTLTTHQFGPLSRGHH